MSKQPRATTIYRFSQYARPHPKCAKCHLHHNGDCPKCAKCGQTRHFARTYLSRSGNQENNGNQGNQGRRSSCYECGSFEHLRNVLRLYLADLPKDNTLRGRVPGQDVAS
ncbi:hypothetical protein Tco_1141787, partial [Tanacetum coccineum]